MQQLFPTDSKEGDDKFVLKPCHCFTTAEVNHRVLLRGPHAAVLNHAKLTLTLGGIIRESSPQYYLCTAKYSLFVHTHFTFSFHLFSSSLFHTMTNGPVLLGHWLKSVPTERTAKKKGLWNCLPREKEVSTVCVVEYLSPVEYASFWCQIRITVASDASVPVSIA